MNRSIVLALSIAIVGCGSPTQAPSMPKPSTDPSPKATVPAPAPAAAPVPSPSPQTSAKGPYNPNRIFQLSQLKKVPMKVGKQTIQLFIMDSPSKRNEGMMFLTDKEVKGSEGMLFVFSDEQERSFWMHNTIVPLDIAFISANGTVVTVASMRSYDDTGTPSLKPAKYVIEMKKGAFKVYGIKAGMKLPMPPGLKVQGEDE